MKTSFLRKLLLKKQERLPVSIYIGYKKGIYRFGVTPDFAEEYYKETGETMMIGMPFFLEVFELSGTALITLDPVIQQIWRIFA